MLPGVGLSGRYLLPVASLLSQRFPVWIVDPPGFAGSDTPAPSRDAAGGAPGPLRDMADVIVAWLDRVGLDRVAVVANSMGCQIATVLAVDHPERVSVLVLQGPTVDPGARTLRSQTLRLAVDSTREPPSMGLSHAVDWCRTGPRRGIAAIRTMLSDRIEDRLPHVCCPSMVVRGSRDPIVTAEWAREAAGSLPDGRLRTVPGASHTMPYSQPLELARVAVPFLGGGR